MIFKHSRYSRIRSNYDSSRRKEKNLKSRYQKPVKEDRIREHGPTLIACVTNARVDENQSAFPRGSRVARWQTFADFVAASDNRN